MRRSKAESRKVVKNYRRISQRRMTDNDNDNDQHEIERLRQIVNETANQIGGTDNHQEIEGTNDSLDNEPTNILSEEFNAEYGQDDLIIVEKKKKVKMPKRVQLTPEELKQAKQLHKNALRKLKQLELRHEQKIKRAELYRRLQESSIEGRDLLTRSGNLGQHGTKKQILQKILQKERAGIELNDEEKDLLYRDRSIPEEILPHLEHGSDPRDVSKEQPQLESTVPSAPVHAKESNAKNRKKKRKADDDVSLETNLKQGDKKRITTESLDDDNSNSAELPVQQNLDTDVNESLERDFQPRRKQLSVAAQMMASLSILKEDSTIQAEKLASDREEAERKRLEEEERQNNSKNRYVPTKPTILKTAATLGINTPDLSSRKKVKEIQRPDDVKATRFDLPVVGMEFEVMDAIRNNDVVIICSETGSGKSTQVPQFIYEGGLTMGPGDTDKHFMVGVTQPRRVAAVSTAKRVCYEMGHGDGQSIQNGKNRQGNLVAYQTRYETSGIGPSTHVKFMTDGILLSEIQSDLLLRNYSVIILDEAHERNLNTDVLIGLLSVALPLRRKAAEEPDSKLVPLKLIIMSATLRVEDFTGNEKLFPSIKPTVVKIPGRTHPVTVHHSKVTDIENYEEAAFKKVCKIHRKLPNGGILLFLTGKQEIIRMVNRLRRVLNKEDRMQNRAADVFADSKDVSPSENKNVNEGFARDMDDEEMDGDILLSSEFDDFDDSEDASEDLGNSALDDDDDDGRPTQALILPLYSMMSAEDQAKVFAPCSESCRLIVVATNIAETSITIPGISYVVDTGRQKCRNFNSGTGVASYDVMWISKAAADQRAGRAGRTGPGHCYRLYSSTMYGRHMDAFALPEVLTRPLEDVVLSMKAMNITNVSSFPFPTPPDKSQVDAAVKLLSSIGCVDTSKVETQGGDGRVTRLGAAVAKLPLGVRYGKMMLAAAQAGVLDYAIVVIAALSEQSPFVRHGQTQNTDEAYSEDIDSDDADRHKEPKAKKPHRWVHKSGDVLATLLAIGAYSYAGRNAGGASEKLACKRFCQENGLSEVIMERIQKMRKHLARLAKARLNNAEGVAARTGGFLSTMSPPNKLQESLLIQSIASGLLDNVAMLAPVGTFSGEHRMNLRTAYISCSLKSREPLFIDRNSVLYSPDFRILPQWVCFDTLLRKTLKDGTSVAVMNNITPIDTRWLGQLAHGSTLLKVGSPLQSPAPTYDKAKDAVLCSVSTKYGIHGWEIEPVRLEMFDALQSSEAANTAHFLSDDSFRWFARFLLEGRVLPELKALSQFLNDSPSILTRRVPSPKAILLTSALSAAGIDSGAALRKHWAEVDDKLLFKCLKHWVKEEKAEEAKKLWIDTVKWNIKLWNDSHKS